MLDIHESISHHICTINPLQDILFDNTCEAIEFEIFEDKTSYQNNEFTFFELNLPSTDQYIFHTLSMYNGTDILIFNGRCGGSDEIHIEQYIRLVQLEKNPEKYSSWERRFKCNEPLPMPTKYKDTDIIFRKAAEDIFQIAIETAKQLRSIYNHEQDWSFEMYTHTTNVKKEDWHLDAHYQRPAVTIALKGVATPVCNTKDMLGIDGRSGDRCTAPFSAQPGQGFLLYNNTWHAVPFISNEERILLRVYSF